MKTKEEIGQLSEKDFNDRQKVGHYELATLKSVDYYYDGFSNGYTQCQEDMYEFGKLVLDTFHSEGKTHSGKDRLARVKFDEWFKQLNKQD